MCSDMFQCSNRNRLLNLSLIYEIMLMCWKKISSLSTGNLPTATMLRQFWPKKQFSVQVLRSLQMTCALKLKPHIHNNEDPWEKNYYFKYWNSLHSNHMEKKTIGLLFWELQYIKWWIFSYGSSLLWIWGLSSKAQAIWSLLSTYTENCFFWPKLVQCGCFGEVFST